MTTTTKVLLGLGGLLALFMLTQKGDVLKTIYSKNWISEEGGPINIADQNLQIIDGQIRMVVNGVLKNNFFGTLDSKGILWTYPASPQSNHYWLPA